MRFNVASFDTREIADAAARCLAHVYRKQHAFKKAGVMLHDLIKRETAQPGLFDKRNDAANHG